MKIDLKNYLIERLTLEHHVDEKLTLNKDTKLQRNFKFKKGDIVMPISCKGAPYGAFKNNVHIITAIENNKYLWDDTNQGISFDNEDNWMIASEGTATHHMRYIYKTNDVKTAKKLFKKDYLDN